MSTNRFDLFEATMPNTGCAAPKTSCITAIHMLTSTQSTGCACASSSGSESVTVLLMLPPAVYTVSNLFSETSRYSLTPSRIANGQTAPSVPSVHMVPSSFFASLLFVTIPAYSMPYSAAKRCIVYAPASSIHFSGAAP